LVALAGWNSIEETHRSFEPSGFHDYIRCTNNEGGSKLLFCPEVFGDTYCKMLCTKAKIMKNNSIFP